MRKAAIAIALLVACKDPPAPAPSPSPAPAPAPAIDARDVTAIIATWWPDGCFVAQDSRGTVRSDATRCAAPRRPHSTFKVPNALIALDAGVLSGPDAAMTWDKARVPDDATFTVLDAWRKPHTLRSGIAVSAVPHFRTLALDLGETRMRDGLARLGYGNQDISGGLDRFWLRGGLRISADQQVAFMATLARGGLAGFSAAAQRDVREVIRLDTHGGATLYGKTGTGFVEDGGERYLASLVGWVERDGEILAFASWMEHPGPFDAAREARIARVRGTLDALGWIAAPPPE